MVRRVGVDCFCPSRRLLFAPDLEMLAGGSRAWLRGQGLKDRGGGLTWPRLARYTCRGQGRFGCSACLQRLVEVPVIAEGATVP